MIADLLRLAGGLGLFLLGMTVMTDGLRTLAGDAMNRLLYRFTRSPWSGALSGTAVTALIQSSSATTVATVGFVNAGLLSFPQALGIVWGANLGTTVTGWIVALIGFKLSLGSVMPTLLLVGMILRIFGRRRLRDTGWMLAGFAIIFVAIEQMRIAMLPFESVLATTSLPGDSVGGRAVLVLIGIAVTIVTQSSSAGVAMALTALHTDAIGFSQAAALVIGMDVGTTASAAMATIGASAQARRTGFSHVVYNLLTGLGAFILLPLFSQGADLWFSGATTANPEIALVGFHTSFNALGVIAVLPFTSQFARFMNWLIADAGPRLTRRLDPLLVDDPSSSTLAVWLTVCDLCAEAFEHIGARLQEDVDFDRSHERLSELDLAIDDTRRYADRLPSDPHLPLDSYRVAAMHCLDHLERLVSRCRHSQPFELLRADPHLVAAARSMVRELDQITTRLRGNEPPQGEDGLQQLWGMLRDHEPEYRKRTLEEVGARNHFDDAIARLDAARWLRRTAYHALRITHHLLHAERGKAAELRS